MADEQQQRTITVEPDWDGMRRWVRHVAKTDRPLAQRIAASMGSEAPDELAPASRPTEHT